MHHFLLRLIFLLSGLLCNSLVLAERMVDGVLYHEHDQAIEIETSRDEQEQAVHEDMADQGVLDDFGNGWSTEPIFEETLEPSDHDQRESLSEERLGHTQPAVSQPVIAIIIDDIGWRNQEDREVLNLPGAVTLAILPQTPNSSRMSNLADEKGKEVMLHIPMQAKKNNHLLGPGALTIDMSKEEFIRTIEDDFRSVPNAIGVNNHMGSLMTQHKLSMHRLMNALQRPSMPFFIDSKTVDSSIPTDVAEIYGIAATRRDVFLDNEQNSEHVLKQFRRLVGIAKQKGSALAIGHPYPETISALRAVLSNLDDFGVRLIPISDFIRQRAGGSYEWRSSQPDSLTAK